MKKSNDNLQTATFTRKEVVQKIFENDAQIFMPVREKGLAFAPTNIALCKYWGKRNQEINLPITGSLSVTLPDHGSMTTLSANQEGCDNIFVNGEKILAETTFVTRIVAFLDLFRIQQPWHLDIHIEMSIPIAAGLASSACGFASLIAALNDLFTWELSSQQLSILARLGSGSAARSFWPGFVEWHAGTQADGMDSYAEPLPYEWPGLRIGILPINFAEKSISSRDAMQRTVDSSVLYHNWPKKVGQDMLLLKQAIKMRNFALLGGTAESNALTMHATMLASWPPICYFQPETIAAMHKIWELRNQGLEVYFTEDAGPNLKLLFLAKDQPTLLSYFTELEPIALFP